MKRTGSEQVSDRATVRSKLTNKLLATPVDLESVDSNMAAKLLHELASVGTYDSTVINSLLLKIVVSEMDHPHCYIALRAMSYFNIGDRKATNLLLTVIADNHGHFSTSEIALAALSGAVLSASSKYISKLITNLIKRGTPPDSAALRNLYHVYLHALYVAHNPSLANKLSEFNYEPVYFIKPTELTTDIQFQLLVHGVGSQPGQYMGVCVELIVGAVAVCINGPERYFRQSKLPTGDTVLKARLLKAMKVPTITIPYFEYVDYPGSKSTYLYEKIVCGY